MTLRIANPYGPWQNWNSAQGAVAVFCHKIMNREAIELFGDGSVARDFIYIDDVIDAFLAAIDAPVLTDSVNIGSGTCRTLKEMISVIEGNLGLPARIQSLPSRGCDVPRSFLDISKAACVLNWAPRTSFAEGIERTIAWQRANPKAY